MQHLFVYGSLLFNTIIEGLTGKTFRTKDANLTGFKRHSLTDADYPAIVKNKSSEVAGKILFDVDKESLEILTFFEGADYQKQLATITLDDKTIEVLTFVWIGDPEMLNKEEWDKEKFAQESLSFYCIHIIPETLREFKTKKN
jgi:gamma-glutamylcyclotransferase (GGCT)/AIG2-like uncharacterized protein YtfP